MNLSDRVNPSVWRLQVTAAAMGNEGSLYCHADFTPPDKEFSDEGNDFINLESGRKSGQEVRFFLDYLTKWSKIP